MDAARLRPWMAQSSARRRPSPVEVSRKLGVAYRELGVDALFRPFVVKEVSSNDTRRFVGLGEPSTVLLRGPLERREYELVRVSFAPLLGFFQNQTDADLLQFEERLALMLGRPQLDAAALVNASMVKVFDLPSLRNIEWTSFLQSVFGKGLRPITARTYVKLASPDYFLRLARGDLLRFSSDLLGYLLFRITMALSPSSGSASSATSSPRWPTRDTQSCACSPQSHYCLRLLNRFEPNLPLHVSRHLAESLLGGENAVEDLVSTLRLVLLESVQTQLGPLNSELRAHLRDKLNAVSWEPLSPRAMDSESTRAEYVDGVYLSNSRLSTAQFVYTWIRKSLEKRLMAHMSTRAAAAGGVAAYPGWTGGFLSAESQLPPPYERLEIPLPVFDFFLNEDPSLRPLQMARAGTKVYRPLLRAVYHWAYNFERGSNAYVAETALSRRMNNLRRCLKRQYSSLSWTEQRPQLDASRTSWSDLWDSLALRPALDAFLLDSGRVAPDYRLALLEHWNASQLFFVSYAANMCENGNQRFLRKIAAQGPHSPAWFRVNGPLRNSLEFARAFGCKHFIQVHSVAADHVTVISAASCLATLCVAIFERVSRWESVAGVWWLEGEVSASSRPCLERRRAVSTRSSEFQPIKKKRRTKELFELVVSVSTPPAPPPTKKRSCAPPPMILSGVRRRRHHHRQLARTSTPQPVETASTHTSTFQPP
ncbi:hypothetical protein HPB51_027369 [Rhipicephalus microplus]|uniref:Peptidase M13 C-terminal domain-containing protein n=1 Tax=Rhipicephalus microplus TaxID=6941 RepID=A0A9J6D037_RHIMP|nr:hypothetical protein HPB51_027369 [Rhipicephalus microplus]